ncbi:MAG: efflux RND transporter permease subunit, partial [Leptospiraceae bacterium]|nr:efflux RND transporter permease subunit [Leptospiraceae bacterium]
MRNVFNYLINNQTRVVSIYILLLIISIIQISNLELSYLPKLPPGKISIITNYPGADPGTVDSMVSLPLINSLSSIKGIDNIKTKSFSEKSHLEIYFSKLQEFSLTLFMIREKLDSLRESLPENVEKPLISSTESNIGPNIILGVFPKNNDEFYKLSKLLENKWKPELEKIEGVSFLEIQGQEKERVVFEIDGKKILKSGYDIFSMYEYITNNYKKFNTGILQIETKEFPVKIKTDRDFYNFTDITLPSENNSIPINNFGNIKLEK